MMDPSNYLDDSTDENLIVGRAFDSLKQISIAVYRTSRRFANRAWRSDAASAVAGGYV
jgi:hypothetical protein